MKIRLWHDWLRAKVEEAPAAMRSGLVIPGAQPVRIGVVLEAGPGRRRVVGKREVLIPTRAKPGDRFTFFKAVSETKQGQALALHLDDDEVLIKEGDILFVIEDGNPEVTL